MIPREHGDLVAAGGTRGIGRAIVREHLLRGDNVFIASRSDKAVRDALSELQVWQMQFSRACV